MCEHVCLKWMQSGMRCVWDEWELDIWCFKIGVKLFTIPTQELNT